MSSLEILVTSDGSHTLRNTDLNETYHSVHGALQESMHVFIANGLGYFVQKHQQKNISVLEVGFGTGLNAMLAWEYAIQNRIHIEYCTLEPFPLAEFLWRQLNYGQLLKDADHFVALHKAGWGTKNLLSAEFTLLKVQTTLEKAHLEGDEYDIVFFDAFAPSVQPEVWMIESLKKIVTSLKPHGVFVTYSAKGQLKRDLRSLGMAVETLAGPPGKNEMTRAVKGR
ncbi:MAG TPA: tRNA (5-methylaminomethyl-2-thiouridine)(34)-methyltransferase MnmD [Chryseosolibacter sp.]